MGVRKAACGLIFLAGLAVAAIEQKGVDPTATQATAVDVGPLAAQFNVSDPVQLKGILGSVVAELLEGRQEKAALRAELDAVKKDKEALENKTHVVEATLRQEVVAAWAAVRSQLQVQISAEKAANAANLAANAAELAASLAATSAELAAVQKSKEVFENKTNAVEATLRQEVSGLQRALLEFASSRSAEKAANATKLAANSTELAANLVAISVEHSAELVALKKSKEAFENKTHVVEATLRQQISGLQRALLELASSTKDGLGKCEAITAPFVPMLERRRTQEDSLCRGEGMTAMLQACCPSQAGSGNGHRHQRRFLQANGCDDLPSTCSGDCAPLFVAYFDACQAIIVVLAPSDRQGLQGLYESCTERVQQEAAVLAGATTAMIFHIVVLDPEAAQQAAMASGGLGSTPSPPLGPVILPPSPADAAVAAQEFRRICTTVNLATCVPECNAVTYGFLLSIEIDGRGTVMTCNVMDGLFAWVGQASLGGYIGAIFAAFFSSVLSSAAGTYLVTLTKNQDVHTDLPIEPGQVVVINGDRSLPQPPTWGNGGFTVGESASLSLGYLQIDTVIQMNEGAGQLTLDSCVLTFTATMVLRAATVTFANLLHFASAVTVSGGTTLSIAAGSSLSFTGSAGLAVQSGAALTISGSSLSFAASVHTGLTVQSGGAATATGTSFQSTNDTLPTASPWTVQVLVSVEDGGSLAVTDSQLVAADGSTDPLPCDGAAATCAAPHAGTVELAGPAKMRKGVPLVCDAASQCVGDLCAVVDCGAGGTCVSPIGTCTCDTANFYSGDRCETHTCCAPRAPAARRHPSRAHPAAGL